jgi:hypothetical protein
MNYRFVLFLFLLQSAFLSAQVKVTAYTETGENNASEGLYLKTAAMANYNFKNFHFAGGLQSDIISNYSKIISGLNLKISDEFKFHKLNTEIQLFFIRTFFSELVKEKNMGILFKLRFSHFLIDIGPDFRRLGYTKKAISKYGIVENHTYWYDNWNTVYSVTYNIKPVSSGYNAGLTITNLDNFLINQVTNPAMNVHGSFKICKSADLIAETWYKAAGIFNLNPNYYAFFIRTGIIWNIK